MQVLKDFNKHGELIDWQGKKEANLLLSESYGRLGDLFKAKYIRTEQCGSFLQFKEYVDYTLKLHKANFCKIRLCPMCSWRRSLKVFGQVSQVLDYLEENHNFRYLFLTLTVKNCYADELDQTIKTMMSAFNKMTRRKAFKSAIKGYFRALEITFNKVDNSYHPHFHIILAVDPNYFNDRKVYLSQKDWSELWKSCLGIDYTPIVNIKAVRKNNKKEIAEVAKYTVKSDDFLIKDTNGNIIEHITDRVVETLDYALYGKRLTSFGFIFKDIHKKLNLDDLDQDPDLINTDIEKEIEGMNYVLVNYVYIKSRRNYFKL